MIVNIVEVLERLGYATVDSDYRENINTWLSWYRGKVEHFHDYQVFNGVSTRKVERASLGMAKIVCEDFANLLLNERVIIGADDERVDEIITHALKANRFEVEGNRTIELAFATGTGAFSEWMDADGVHIDYHDARSVYPLAWSGHNITECAFSSVETCNGKKCMYLRLYTWSDRKTQLITNKWLDYESGKPLPVPEGMVEQVDTGITVPLFQIVRPNIANNIDTTTPMGISVFANSIDILKALDETFDSFYNEYLLGRKRLLVPMSMVKLSQVREGERQPIFDPNDLVYTAYEAGEDQNDFHDLSPEIRSDAHLTGLRTQLNILSFKCGLGTGRYNFDKSGGVKTATEVISEQSDLYQSVCKHELMLGDALRSLAIAICACNGITVDDIRVTFDDSIVQDKVSIRTEAREEVAQGLMSKYRYLVDVKGMGEYEAREELQHIADEQKITGNVIDFFQREDEQGDA